MYGQPSDQNYMGKHWRCAYELNPAAYQRHSGSMFSNLYILLALRGFGVPLQVAFSPGEGRVISLDASSMLCCSVTATLEQLFFTRLYSPVGPTVQHWSPQCSSRRASLLQSGRTPGMLTTSVMETCLRGCEQCAHRVTNSVS